MLATSTRNVGAAGPVSTCTLTEDSAGCKWFVVDPTGTTVSDGLIPSRPG